MTQSLLKILVVDDLPENVELIRRYLESNLYQVRTAANAKEALGQIRRELFDLILLDIVMPGMSGIDLCRVLKTHERTRHIPIILVTAVTQVKDKIRGFEAGAEDYISKPFSGAELLARVKSVLRIKTLHDEMRLANEKLRETLAQLKDAQSQLVKNEKVSVIQATVASVNHEINNPLCSISLDVQMLQIELAESDESVLLKLKRIEENVKRIHRVTQKLARIKDPSASEFLPGQQILDLG